MQAQSGATSVISSGILRPIGNQVGAVAAAASGVALLLCRNHHTSTLYGSAMQRSLRLMQKERRIHHVDMSVSALVRCCLPNDPPVISLHSPPLLSSLPPQITLPWALLFAVLGVLCRIPGVLYQSSKAGVACGRFMAHVCLIQV